MGSPGYSPSLKRYPHHHSCPTLLTTCQATDKLLDDPLYNHEYLPITGLPAFTLAAAKLILGRDSSTISEGRVASVQTVSGTGANHLAALFLSRYYNFNGQKQVYVSNPTWGRSIPKSVLLGPADVDVSEPLCAAQECWHHATRVPIL